MKLCLGLCLGLWSGQPDTFSNKGTGTLPKPGVGDEGRWMQFAASPIWGRGLNILSFTWALTASASELTALGLAIGIFFFRLFCLCFLVKTSSAENCDSPLSLGYLPIFMPAASWCHFCAVLENGCMLCGPWTHTCLHCNLWLPECLRPEKVPVPFK